MFQRLRWWIAGGMLTMLFASSIGCEVPPRFVRQSGEIDAFISQGAYASACVGLKMRDNASLRAYTAEKLAEYRHIKVANDCLCEALYDPEKHTFDPEVATGLKGTNRDDLAECLAPALTDTAITGKKRANLVRVLGDIDARSAYGSIEALVLDDPDPEVRARAAAAVRPCDGCVDTVIKALESDSDPSVRAAAAGALDGRKSKDVIAALVESAKNDGDADVRAAAIGVVGTLNKSDTDRAVCKAMMDDPDPRVRAAAVGAIRGTKRKSAVDCLRKRLLTEEEDSSVRVAVLEALRASPSDAAAVALCDAIGPFLRMYAKDKIVQNNPDLGIVEFQNDRDWDRSFECVSKALRQGGYSCFARNYLGHWMKQLGGKASTPWCPGMIRQ